MDVLHIIHVADFKSGLITILMKRVTIVMSVVMFGVHIIHHNVQKTLCALIASKLYPLCTQKSKIGYSVGKRTIALNRINLN